MKKPNHSSTELQQFKTDIDLVEFAVNQYGYIVDAKRSSPNSVVLRKADREKLIITRDLDGHYVYFAPITPFVNDFGSIIDFIQVRRGVTLGQVRGILRAYQGTSSPHLPGKRGWFIPKIKPVHKNTLAVIKAYEGFSDLSDSAYLESRGLKREIYTDPRFASKIRVDKNGNLIFPHFDRQGICGFERKNRDFKGFSAGGKKALWSSNRYAHDQRLIITEAVIDALSYHALFGDSYTRYASASGAWNDTTEEMIGIAAQALPKANGQVILAYDNDTEGQRYRYVTREVLKDSGKQVIDHLPGKKDFNDDLKAMAQ